MRQGNMLIPAVVTFFAVAAFLLVLNFAIPPVKKTTTNKNTNTSSAVPAPGFENVNEMIVGNTNAQEPTNTNTDATAGWKTYTNNDLGFSIRTPQDWDVDTTRSSNTEVVFLPNPGTESREAIKSTVSDQSLTDWVKTYDQSEVASVTDITVAGQPAKLVKTNAFALNYIGFRHNDRLFVVTTNTKILDLGILDTFTFTK